MSIVQYGVRFVCDLCRATGDGPPLPPGIPDYPYLPVPDGWTDTGQLHLRDMFGVSIQHLCPGCSLMSIGGVAARMRELTEAKTNG